MGGLCCAWVENPGRGRETASWRCGSAKKDLSDATGHSGIVTSVSNTGVVTVMAAHSTKISVDMSFQPGSKDYSNRSEIHGKKLADIAVDQAIHESTDTTLGHLDPTQPRIPDQVVCPRSRVGSIGKGWLGLQRMERHYTKNSKQYRSADKARSHFKISKQ